MDINYNKYSDRAIELLKRLIATPSVSRDETKAADIMEQCIGEMGFEPHREVGSIAQL